MESEEACTRSSCSGVGAVRKTAAAALFIKERECSDLVRDDGEYAAAVEGPALCSGGTDAGGVDRHSAVQNTRYRALLSTTPIWMASIFFNFLVK